MCSGVAVGDCLLCASFVLRNCRCFELPPTSKFLILHVWPGWCAKRTQGLYWFGQNVPTSSSLLLLMLLALKVCSRGYKWSREGHVPSLWWCVEMNFDWFGWVRIECLLCDVICDGSFVRCPLMGLPAFPFIGQGKAWVTTGEKRRMRGQGSL